METTVNTQKRKLDNSGSWKSFFFFLRHSNLSWGWILLSLLVNIVYYITVSKLPGSTAGLYAGKFSSEAIQSAIISYVSLLVAQACVSVCSLIANTRSVLSARRSIWKRMMGIQNGYYDEKSAGTLLSAITSDTEQTVSSLINLLILIPGLLTYLVQALMQIQGYSPKLLIAIVVLIPVYILYALFMGRWQYRVGRSIQMRIGSLTGFLSERIRNLTLIKSFVTEPWEEQNGERAAKDLYKANLDFAHVNAVVIAYTMVTEVVGIVIAVIWGSTLLRNGEIDLPAWLAFFLFVPTINTVLRQLTSVWSNLKDIQGRASRLGELMEAPQEDRNETAPAEIPSGDITLKDVHFSYREGTPILSNVSFSIPKGKVTAIVGPTGSGKTTVLRLIEKLYLPQSGQVTVGGEALNLLNLSAWRDHLSYVNQDAELFSGTVREALTYGIKRDVSDEELSRVTKLAGIYDFITAGEKGFDAELSLWGSAMSGGQRQRMVIARELLKNADILLLDEPTSALDAETASAISETFFTGFAGKTIVTVTHELNFIAKADRIVVLKHGAVEGIGTHEELMRTCDTYRQLVEEQSYQEVFA
ncbi:MAG: ABC transporter ATP-binding protein [Lachnospiraceae bacterium]|nr:ABC transporter ATP-binding protein [Lachnospiraceae bacterium]